LRLSSPLQWRDRAGFSPVFPDAQSVKISKRKLHREKSAVKSYFPPLHFHDLHFTGRGNFVASEDQPKDQRNRDDRKKRTQHNDGRREIRILAKLFCEFSVALQGCEENEAQGFTQLDDRAKVVSID
jgi:hypothetical protein